MARFRYIVTDVDQAVAFYTTILGFSLEQNFAPAVAILQREDLELVVSGPKASASMPMPDGSQPVSGGWNRIVILTEDLDKLVSKLREEGIKFRNEILPRAWRKPNPLRRPVRESDRTLSAGESQITRTPARQQLSTTAPETFSYQLKLLIFSQPGRHRPRAPSRL